MSLRAVPVLLVVLGLSACTTLPHPFEDDKLAPHAALLTMPDALGVVVEPVQGAPGTSGQKLAGAMALALQQAEVPASTQAGNSRSFHLIGTAVEAPDGPPGLEIRWSMRNAAGTEIGGDSLHLALPEGEAADPATLAPLLRAEAPKLASLIQDSVPDEHLPTRHLLVREIAGAPGDGAKALKRALVFLLKRNGTARTEDSQSPDTVAIAGTVEARPGPADQDHIKISWHVLRPDGAEAGVIAQENDVPRAIIEGQWGDIAMAVADAAAPDILRVAATVPEGHE